MTFYFISCFVPLGVVCIVNAEIETKDAKKEEWSDDDEPLKASMQRREARTSRVCPYLNTVNR